MEEEDKTSDLFFLPFREVLAFEESAAPSHTGEAEGAPPKEDELGLEDALPVEALPTEF